MEIHKDAACCSEQTREAAPYKTVAVQPLTSHLANHPRKASKTYWVLPEKQGWTQSDILLWTPTQGHTSVGQSTKTGCHLEDLPRAMADRDGWRVRERKWEWVKRICAVGTPWWWEEDDIHEIIS